MSLEFRFRNVLPPCRECQADGTLILGHRIQLHGIPRLQDVETAGECPAGKAHTGRCAECAFRQGDAASGGSIYGIHGTGCRAVPLLIYYRDRLAQNHFFVFIHACNQRTAVAEEGSAAGAAVLFGKALRDDIFPAGLRRQYEANLRI